ncbi:MULTISPECIES: hypothetical protein [Paenibacillus]|uniref:Uncharacterized protein n=2 Tax=Paenibacillus TaxID=44249 RepID=A0A5S5BRK6_9BACL|nr:hypothetical protein [Paenibacillus methanolicus]TYP68926.1 hypothetical protein BCM02_11744 [Paenibacillus methanolicus]
MSGRNNKPKNNGPAASPSRLDQFGDKLSDDTAVQKPSSKND